MHRSEIEAGEPYLLCSNGLWESVPRRAMTGGLAGDAPLAARAEALVRAARSAASSDDVTVVLVPPDAA